MKTIIGCLIIGMCFAACNDTSSKQSEKQLRKEVQKIKMAFHK